MNLQIRVYEGHDPGYQGTGTTWYLGHGLHKLISVSSCHWFSKGKGVRVFLIQIEHLRELPHNLRHYILHQSKIKVHKKGMDALYILSTTREFQVMDHTVIHPLDHGVAMFLIKLELERESILSYWYPPRHWFHWLPWGCIPWIWGTWIWGTWYGLPCRGLPWNWTIYGSWDCMGVWYMSKVLLSCIMRPLLLVNWYLGVPLGFLMPSIFQSY